MPRPPRLLLSKSFYHIITRGNNQNIVFRESRDYDYYLSLIARIKKELPLNIYHYCLMPNHVHMLVQVKNAKNFATFMKRINLIYFYYYKKHYKWIGHFWQDRYKSQVVGKDEYFIQCGKYIELNPVRAKLVENPENYHYSSYRHYALGESNNLITQDIFYESLGQTKELRQKAYRDFIISEIIKNSYKKTGWGSFEQRRNEYLKTTYHLKLKKKKL